MSFGIFLYGNILFVLTLLAVCLSLGMRFERHKPVVWRTTACCALVLPVVSVTYLYYRLYAGLPSGSVLFYVASAINYLLLFAIVLLSLCMLFDEPVWQLLLCAISAYAAQHIFSNVFALVRSVFGFDVLLLSGNLRETAEFLGIQLVITVALFVVLYFTFIRVANRNYVRGAYTRETLYTSLMTLLIVLVLNLFRDLYSHESIAMNIICGMFSILSCSFILLIYTSILTQNRLRAEYETVSELWNKDKKQYALTKDSIEMINIKCHDLKKRLEIFEEQGGADKSEVEDLKNAIDIYDAALKTGNGALDTLLMEYLISCEKHNIRFTCTVDGEKLSFMQAEDIYSLFSNLISNAMEAVQALDDPEKRVIGLVIREQSGMLVVQMENYYAGVISMKDGIPQTTKRDESSHGFGIKSMRILVDKYGGVMSFSISDEIFAAHMIFPLSD